MAYLVKEDAVLHPVSAAYGSVAETALATRLATRDVVTQDAHKTPPAHFHSDGDRRACGG